MAQTIVTPEVGSPDVLGLKKNRFVFGHKRDSDSRPCRYRQLYCDICTRYSKSGFIL